MKIALDAMGGDFGPPNLVAGAVMALCEYQQINKLYLVGDSARIEAELKEHGCNDNRIEITHATQVVDMSDRAWSAAHAAVCAEQGEKDVVLMARIAEGTI